MNTNEFLQLLKEHQDKSLIFEYAPGVFVGANYHITEVKNVTIEAVDCGAGTDAWKETVIQLWESPSEIGKTTYLTVFKALGILSKVNKMKPIDGNTILKFEYGNATFHTAQLLVNGFSIINNSLIIRLTSSITDCKAKEVCGIPEPASSNSCTPGSGCC